MADITNDDEHPIHFLRTELMDFTERMRWIGTDENKVRRAIDLSAENIIEHFNLETNYKRKGNKL